MPRRVRLALVAMSLSVLIVTALPIVRELTRRTDIWWTPRTMLVPLADSADRVEIYVHGQPLAKLIQAGQVQVLDEGRPVSLGAGDVGLRFNNSDRVRAERLPRLLLSGALFGAAALYLLFLVTGRLVYREERAR
jgi:hypothetical protein